MGGGKVEGLENLLGALDRTEGGKALCNKEQNGLKQEKAWICRELERIWLRVRTTMGEMSDK